MCRGVAWPELAHGEDARRTRFDGGCAATLLSSGGGMHPIMKPPPDVPPATDVLPAPDEPPPPGREPLAYHDAGFIDSDEGRPLRILAEYLKPLGVFRRRRIHDTIVFFGSARITKGGAMGAYYAGAESCAPRDRLVGRTPQPGPPLSGVHRRRPRDHGGRQPRRPGGRRPVHRPQHRPPARAAPESLHHAGPVVRVPLLLHAQAVDLLRRAGDHRVPRRLRHPG